MLDVKSVLCYASGMTVKHTEPQGSSSQTVEFVHPGLGQEVRSIAGYYTLIKELKLDYNKRQVLCLIGMCAVESSCCGSTSFYYSVVPGYIVNWKARVNEAGLPVSIVEPIKDTTVRRALENMIGETEGVNKLNIEFW